MILFLWIFSFLKFSEIINFFKKKIFMFELYYYQTFIFLDYNKTNLNIIIKIN